MSEEISICTPGDPPKTVEDAKAIVMAEYHYWRQQNCDGAIFALGAIANIYAGLCGMMAPWHPKQKAKDE